MKAAQYVVALPVITLCATLTIRCHVDGSRESNHNWRAAQENAVAEAVLADLADMPPETVGDVRPAVCVGIGENVGTSARDPDAALLRALKARRPQTFSASECEMKGTLERKVTGEKAVLVGLGRVGWKADGFVQVRAWRFVSPVSATQWDYSLSYTGGKWVVDTAKRVSAA